MADLVHGILTDCRTEQPMVPHGGRKDHGSISVKDPKSDCFVISISQKSERIAKSCQGKSVIPTFSFKVEQT